MSCECQLLDMRYLHLSQAQGCAGPHNKPPWRVSSMIASFAMQLRRQDMFHLFSDFTYNYNYNTRSVAPMHRVALHDSERLIYQTFGSNLSTTLACHRKSLNATEWLQGLVTSTQKSMDESE